MLTDIEKYQKECTFWGAIYWMQQNWRKPTRLCYGNVNKVSPSRDVTLLARCAVPTAHTQCLAALQTTTDDGDRCQRAKQYRPIRRASNNVTAWLFANQFLKLIYVIVSKLDLRYASRTCCTCKGQDSLFTQSRRLHCFCGYRMVEQLDIINGTKDATGCHLFSI